METFETQAFQNFYTDLHQEVQTSVSAEEDGGIREERFTQLVLDILAEAGETENARECHDIKEDSMGRKIHKVSGYALSETYENLDLFVTLFRGSEQPSKINKEELTTASNQVTRFLKNALNRYFEDIEETSAVYDLAQTLAKYGKDIVRVNVFIIADGITSGQAPNAEGKIREIPIFYKVIDFDYLYKIQSSKHGRVPIEIDFEKEYNGAIPCLPMPNSNDDYESYLAIISGDTLASIYGKFGARLLEQNVRSFLQFTGKINKGIQQTIRKEPHMFLAFNNGIAATAENVELIDLPTGGTAIKSIRDLQIVNGGQTTASVFYTNHKEKLDISQLSIQMKLSVIKDADRLSEIVSRIAEYANTQNKVSTSDLTANSPFQIALEKWSRTIWTPAQNNRSGKTRWFYERARGQYKNAILKEGISLAKRKAFELQNPKNQMFVKEDVSKYFNAWGQKPWFVVRGGQKNYTEFMKDRKKEIPDNIFFEDIIAKGILFRTAEKLYGKKPYAIGEIRYIVVPYALSCLNYITDNKLDLEKIWKKQSVSTELETLLKEILLETEKYMKKSAEGALYSEWAKKEDCWDKLLERKAIFSIDTIKNDIAANKSNRVIMGDDEQERLEQERLINRIKDVPSKYWDIIERWGAKNENLSRYKCNIALQISGKILKNKFFTPIEIKQGIEILDKIIDEVPELLHDIDDEIIGISQDTEIITLPIIQAIVIWDRTKRKLKDFQWKFMDSLSKGEKPLNDSNLSRATCNWKIVKQFGFRYKEE
jgi:AIPR protein